MLRKIYFFIIVYVFSLNAHSNDNDVLMRMYERLEMIRLQMQDLTEDNQQLNNKIINLQGQQDRLYQDLLNKIKELEHNLEKNKTPEIKSIIPNVTNVETAPDNSALNNKIVSENTENIAKQKDNKKNKKLEDIIPKEENELDLAKKYTNDNFKKNYQNINLKMKLSYIGVLFN